MARRGREPDAGCQAVRSGDHGNVLDPPGILSVTAPSEISTGFGDTNCIPYPVHFASVTGSWTSVISHKDKYDRTSGSVKESLSAPHKLKRCFVEEDDSVTVIKCDQSADPIEPCSEHLLGEIRSSNPNMVANTVHCDQQVSLDCTSESLDLVQPLDDVEICFNRDLPKSQEVSRGFGSGTATQDFTVYCPNIAQSSCSASILDAVALPHVCLSAKKPCPTKKYKPSHNDPKPVLTHVNIPSSQKQGRGKAVVDGRNESESNIPNNEHCENRAVPNKSLHKSTPSESVTSEKSREDIIAKIKRGIPHTDLYKCNECDEEFDGWWGYFLQHKMTEHSGNRTYKCDLCGEMLPDDQDEQDSSESVSEHFRNVHGLESFVHKSSSNTYQCVTCVENHSHPLSFLFHLEECHLNEGLRCFLCGYRHIHRYQMTKHITQQHSTEDLKGVCKLIESFGLKEGRRALFFDWQWDGSESCHLCQVIVTHKNLLNHLVSIHGNVVDDDKYECFRCGAVKKSYWQLQLHLFVCPSLHQCCYCHANLNNMKNLLSHLKRYHLGLKISKTLAFDEVLICGFRKHKEVCQVPSLPSPTETLGDLQCTGQVAETADLLEEEQFQCFTCDQMYDLPLELCVHIMNEHPREKSTEGEPVCVICMKSYKHGTVGRHMRDVHGIADFVDASRNNTFRCSKCSNTHRDELSYVFHLEDLHMNNAVKCSLCGYVTIYRYQLFRHMMKTHGHMDPADMVVTEHRPMYNDPWWKRAFGTQTDKSRNMKRRHWGTCGQCGKKPSTGISLVKHVQNKHPKSIASAKYQCFICKKIYRTLVVLQSHWHQKHTGPQCHFCKCICYNRKVMDKHLCRNHLKISKSCCDQCHKTFSTPRSYSNHLIRVHEGRRDYLCEECGRGFKTRSILKIHRRQHSGEKPIMCNQCGFQCRQPNSLNWHMKKHHPLVKIDVH